MAPHCAAIISKLGLIGKELSELSELSELLDFIAYHQLSAADKLQCLPLIA